MHQLQIIFYPFFTKILIIRRHWRRRWERNIDAVIKESATTLKHQKCTKNKIHACQVQCHEFRGLFSIIRRQWRRRWEKKTDALIKECVTILGHQNCTKNKLHACQVQCHEFRGLLSSYYVTLSARQKWLYINTTSNWGCHRKCTMIKHSVYKKGSLKQCITKLWVNKWLYPLSDRKRRLELCRSQLGNGSEVMHHIPWLCVPNSVHDCFFLYHDVTTCAWKGIVYGGQQEFSECTYRIQIWAYSFTCL